MDNILNQFNEKITSLVNNYLVEDIFVKGVSNFTEDVVAEFAEFGRNLTAWLANYVEEEIFKTEGRKKQFESLEKDKRSVITVFGEIDYSRRYYRNKETGEKEYLLDKILQIMPKQRLLDNVRTKLIDEAVESSYEHAGETAAYGIKISRQEVKNEIESLNLKQDFYVENPQKRMVKNIYVIADEDHVHLQKGGIEEPRIVIVYDQIEVKGKRVELKNKHHIGGIYTDKIDELWDEVAMYIENTYDMDYVENVFIQGDGANWIKTGKTWINKSINILDEFHLSKAISSIAGKENIECKKELYKAISSLDFKLFEELCCEILSEEMNHSIRLKKEKLMRYVLNNSQGIINLYKYREFLHGCSAEGHVSHVLSARMSSRPMGWKTENVDNMSRLRLLKADNIEIKDIVEKQPKIIDISECKQIIEQTKKKIKKNIDFRPNSLPIMTYGSKIERLNFKWLLSEEAL